MSPLWQLAEIFWALAKGLVAHRLECFKILAALLTRILVGWHESVITPLGETAVRSLHETRHVSSCAA